MSATCWFIEQTGTSTEVSSQEEEQQAEEEEENEQEEEEKQEDEADELEEEDEEEEQEKEEEENEEEDEESGEKHFELPNHATEHIPPLCHPMGSFKTSLKLLWVIIKLQIFALLCLNFVFEKAEREK